MPKASSPNHADPRLLEAVLRDTQDAYARLLTLIENSLQADPAAEPAAAEPLDAQVREATSKADACLGVLRGFIEPWDRRRADYPAETAGDVDRFLGLLEKGLRGLRTQVAHRTSEVEALRSALRETLQKLRGQRAGLRGYRQKGAKSRLLNKKA